MIQPVCGPPEVNDNTIAITKGFKGFASSSMRDTFAVGYGHQCSQPLCTEMRVRIDEPMFVSLMTKGSS